MFERWIVPDKKVKCYSYIRWSSEDQAKGTTRDRQSHAAQKIADDNGLQLVPLDDDEGVSAFKGQNRKEGPLKDFIDAVTDGVIPANSWLVVENLDRLSREDIFSAQQLFHKLLELGVVVVTAMDGKIYRYETVKANPTELMYSIMLFARAHEESKTKSKRTYGNALAIIRKHEAGERSSDGFSYAIKSVGNNVWWSDCSDGFVKPHPFYFDVAKEIIDLILKGWGNYRMAAYLNEKYPPPTKNKHNAWSQNLLSRFYTRRALFGEKRLSIDGVEYVLPDYYPPLIDEDTFYKLGHIKREKISKSTAVTHVHLASGLGILKCGKCSGNMYAFTHRKKELRYICGTGQQNLGCRPWTFSATWLEDTLLRLAANHVFRPQDLKINFEIEEQALRAKRRDKEVEIERLVAAIADGSPSKAITKRIAGLELELEDIEANIRLAAIKKQIQIQETVEWGAVDEKVLDFKQDEIRHEIRLRISNSVHKIECVQVKAKHIFFLITFINGKSIMAHRTPKALAFDGGAWVKLGDHFGSKVPVSESEQDVLGMELEDDFIYEKETDELLAKYAIDPAEVSGYDGYRYEGLYNVSAEMVEAYKKGEAPKQLQADILRVQHLIEWADGIKGAPEIIEDQFQVYKHPSAKKVLKKEVAGITYVEGTKFFSEIVPAWQR